MIIQVKKIAEGMVRPEALHRSARRSPPVAKHKRHPNGRCAPLHNPQHMDPGKTIGDEKQHREKLTADPMIFSRILKGEGYDGRLWTVLRRVFPLRAHRICCCDQLYTPLPELPLDLFQSTAVVYKQNLAMGLLPDNEISILPICPSEPSKC